MGSDGEVGGVEGAEGDDGGGGELEEPIGHAWAAHRLAVFVPLAILDLDRLFSICQCAHRRQDFARGDAVGIRAGEKRTPVGRLHSAVRNDHGPINMQRNLPAGEIQTLAMVTSVVQVEPQPAAIEAGRFFDCLCGWRTLVGLAEALLQGVQDSV